MALSTIAVCCNERHVVQAGDLAGNKDMLGALESAIPAL
jgi:hypothetical protein